jgi:MFS family permease
MRLEDSREFVEALSKTPKSSIPVLSVLRLNWREVLSGFAVGSLLFASYCLAFSYSQIHLIATVGLSASNAALGPTFSLIFSILLMPFVAHWGDVYERKPMLVGAIIIAVICSLPGFALVNTGSLLSGRVVAAFCLQFLAPFLLELG